MGINIGRVVVSVVRWGRKRAAVVYIAQRTTDFRILWVFYELLNMISRSWLTFTCTLL